MQSRTKYLRLQFLCEILHNGKMSVSVFFRRFLLVFQKVLIFRNSHPELFLRKGVLKICSKFTRNTPNLQFAICNFIEIALRYGCSPVNLLHIFRTPFLKDTSGCLLLDFERNNKHQVIILSRFQILLKCLNIIR